MGIFKKKGYDTRTQWEWALEQLMNGAELSQLDMLMDFGIGHHCNVIMICRKKLQEKGYPYDYIKTDFIHLTSKRTGRRIKFAVYSIPEKVAERKKHER